MVSKSVPFIIFKNKTGTLLFMCTGAAGNEAAS